MQEEIIYCSSCGAANKASAVVCCECKKEIRLKHWAIFRFMKEHIQDKLKGEIEDKTIEIVKKYLLSHIYGIIITILLVTAGVAFAVPKGEYYIPNEGEALAVMSRVEPVETVIEYADKEELWAISMTYQKQADFLLANHGRDTGTDIHSLFAQSVPGFPYNGTHDMEVNGIAPAAEGRRIFGSGTRAPRKFLVNEELTSPLAITLRDNGYEVCEGVFSGGLNFDLTPVDTNKIEECDVSRYYQMVYVKLSGKWYIAEDILL